MSKAFDQVKHVITKELVLALVHYIKLYDVHMDAWDYEIEGLLMHDGHLIAFESRKLNDTKRRYMVQEKDMIVVVHCLSTWRHYLLGSRFMVCTTYWLFWRIVIISLTWVMMLILDTYVKTCLVCQQDKVELKLLLGLLQPFPISERPWKNISMDFIIGLPK
ncbi:reverse transcriptase [Gossypium australe]|uniref:Reverse transcriptase n=1 Tax=Gossypium australe TaxID=47621 RepID=A0A5B6VD64_9ROSI|nr:reverse transcriptase [Gossypium australe]